ncbi:MAG TPA: transcription elongation factor GreA [Candidatus Tectomicrobia bacterium]|nr:transcription elongation factor GreA [Candidatus Tectomicrobia bacterium]
MAEKAPMTRQGYEALLNELKHLKAVIRPQVIEAVRQAREEGDLRENAEYHGAKEKQAILEAKIRHLETQLANAQVIDTGTLGGDRVVFGATVQVRETESDEEKAFRLVGADEANPQRGWISIQSPVGRALVGKQIGETVEVRVPRGTLTYEIVCITFES